MTTSMNIINFSLGERRLRYKFRTNDEDDFLEKSIRRQLHIPVKVMVSFVDLKDNAVVSISLLKYLDNESHVDIILEPLEELEMSVGQCVRNDASLCDLVVDTSISSGRGVDSFSDNNEKVVILDLSSPSSSTSESDHKYVHASLHYKSTIDGTGGMKIRRAQLRRQNRDTVLKCNKKIHHFLSKYAHLDPIKAGHVVNLLLGQLKLKHDGLYNFLKHIRNTKTAASLGLNSDNVVSVLTCIYHESYLDHCES